ncbi:PQQ-dependent sugar dehydrogenase [Winogradskyella sp. PG-2]|uniref:PQQ-dependent sugar dehydrogenase n=1 Tax=Winogradskyella sp. PG-2 TaxID=754409 RepID=UPI0005EF6E05|nr:PQQ-dependent sugar dehydrogenase [Winogradskyella sp. PG-2]
MKSLSLLTLSLFFCFNLSYTQDLELELFSTGLNNPVNLKHAGDQRLFAAEQNGIIKIINSNGSVVSAPFLDISGRVESGGNEEGLLGLAFHPDYATNGYFFVNYIKDVVGAFDNETVISRFTRSNSNPSLGDPNSEFVILTYTQPYSNHNGGDLAFGADGYLYISSGDGGSGGDPDGNSQNTTNLLGNILRIDVNNTTAALNYSIPSDNPFVGSSTIRPEIWAYGLRNPWKFSFDRLNNDIWIADVGQGNYEEINRASGSLGGLNYGWRCYEGNSIFNSNNCPSSSTLTFPVSGYNHFGDGEFKCSITGGYVYRGPTYTPFTGSYFFADYCSSEIGFITYNSTLDNWDMTLEEFTGNWSAFGEDVDGEIYVSDIQSGNIYKITDALLSIDENKINSIPIYPNPVKDRLNIDFSNYHSATSTEIVIYSIHGKIVKSVNLDSENIQKIDTSELANGIYLLKINSNNGDQSTHKLVIN